MHPSTNRRIWQPINTRPHSASPRAIAEPVSPPPARIFAAPRPAFPNPRTQPLTPCPSNRYSEKIEFHVSYRKQSTLTFSNRYIHRGSFAAGFLPNPRFPLTPSTKINRKPGKIEHLVSHRKQRTGTQINRKLFILQTRQRRVWRMILRRRTPAAEGHSLFHLPAPKENPLPLPQDSGYGLQPPSLPIRI